MLRTDILVAAAAIAAFCLAFGLGFIVGYGLRNMQRLIDYVHLALEEHKLNHAEEERPESAVADSSPQHLKEKREERIRKGEDPDDNEDSQIITTKTPEQLRAEADMAKESKLDKWMPGVKHGKS